MKRISIVLILGLVLCLFACTAQPAVQRGEIPAINKTFTPYPIDPEKYPHPVNFLNPDAYEWVEIASGFSMPLGIFNAGDGSDRLFVVEQAGVIRIIQDGVALSEPFLNITSKVDVTHNEQGMLGLAFHPNYEVNGYFYVYYIDHQFNSVLARFQVSPEDPNRADPASEKQIMLVKQPFHNNNGGGLAFGRDGYLYWGLGDGGDWSDPDDNSQNPNSLLGKILRIDVNTGDPYSIPPDNFYRYGGGRPEIWALGVRNPWRFSFDSATGDFYLGDVGQATVEEIDFIPFGSSSGLNLGWDFQEGFRQFNLVDELVHRDFYDPIFEYDHTVGCAAMGGEVYRGPLNEWRGLYLFGDYCYGKVWGMKRDANGKWQIQLIHQLGRNIVAFGSDDSRNIYIVVHPGSLLRLQAK